MNEQRDNTGKTWKFVGVIVLHAGYKDDAKLFTHSLMELSPS
jgi:hypothetical protein